MNYRGKEKEGLPPPNGFDNFRPKGSHRPKKLFSFAPGQVFQINWKFLACVIIYWIMLVHTFERTVPKLAMKTCLWTKWEPWDSTVTPHRVAIVADPQVVDDNTYPGQPRIINYFVRKISDNYLYRNYAYLQGYLDPDSTIFLGDLFDGGREWDDSAWLKEYQRFQQIFPKRVNRQLIQSLPGNHDIGFQKISTKVTDRFLAFFGEPNDYLEVGNHYIVLLDTISLSHPDQAVKQEAMDFLDSLQDKLNPQFPRILITHVPLFRFNDKQLCGPLRESSQLFPVQFGKQYQTVIDFDISQTILSTVNPDIVFSGDDHDYCDVQHSYTHNGKEHTAREITVKTASMTNGIKYPAIQLLSLHNPYSPNPKTRPIDEEPIATHSTQMCYLPSPYLALNMYILSYVVSLAVVVIWFMFPEWVQKVLLPLTTSLHKSSVLPLFGTATQTLQSTSFTPSERSLASVVSHSLLLTLAIFAVFGFYYRKI